jgi:hypothetical protein
MPFRIITFEVGTMKTHKIKANKSYPINVEKRYHKQPGLPNPKDHVIMYIVKGKPYISINRATINAK